MRKILPLFLIIFMAFSVSNAYEFNVLALNGKTQVKKGKKWINLKSGDKLTKKQSIKIGKNSYIGMVHKNGTTLEVKDKGTYKVSSLVKKVIAKDASTTKRMADYVIEEMSSADDLFEKDDYHGSMSTLGSVERAVGEDINALEKAEDIAGTDHSISSNLNSISSLVSGDGYNTIQARMPKTSYLIDSKVEFSWQGGNTEKYFVVIKDDKNKIIAKKEVRGKKTPIDLQELGVQPGKCYYWKVESGKDKSIENCIMLMDKRTFPEFFVEYDKIRKSTGEKPGAMDELILAAFFEDYNVMNRAYACYRNAVIKSGRSPDMEKLFASYLDRIGCR